MTERVDTLRTIETPEGVELTLRVAGPVPRAMAWVVDGFLRACGYVLVGFGLAFLGDTGTGLFLIVLFLGEWLYPVGFEVYNKGETPGKLLFGLAVVHDDGTPVGWNASLLRNLLRVADFLPFAYLLGILSMLISRDFKRLGDLAAGTVVTYRRGIFRAQQLPAAAPVPAPVPLRLDEQRAIIDFAARSEEWTQERVEELAELLTDLSGAEGEAGAKRLYGLARWLQGSR